MQNKYILKITGIFPEKLLQGSYSYHPSFVHSQPG